MTKLQRDKIGKLNVIHNLGSTMAGINQQDGKEAKFENQDIDLTLYEKDSILIDLAQHNIYNDLKKLLTKKPFYLKDGQEIRVARALIAKHFKSGM